VSSISPIKNILSVPYLCPNRAARNTVLPRISRRITTIQAPWVYEISKCLATDGTAIVMGSCDNCINNCATDRHSRILLRSGVDPNSLKAPTILSLCAIVLKISKNKSYILRNRDITSRKMPD